MSNNVMRAGSSTGRTLLACFLLTASPALLAAQDTPTSIAFPGSFWLAAGDVGPAERGNVVGQAGFEQGITAWSQNSWYLVPFLSATLSNDSMGYEWNNKHPATLGVKLTRRVPGGVVQAGGGVMLEHDPMTGHDRHGTAFANYWAGWTADRRAHLGSGFGGFPGHVSAGSGLLTGRDPHNWMTSLSAQQGVVAFRSRIFAAVPYVSGDIRFDTKRRTWENRVTYDAGFKIVRPVVGGVLEAGVAERRQHELLSGLVDSAPVVYLNLWIGWNPRSISR